MLAALERNRTAKADAGPGIKHPPLLAELAVCAALAVRAATVLALGAAGAAATAAVAAAATPPKSADAAEAQARLAAVRARIAALTDRLGLELRQRDALSARLRAADLEITAQRRRLDALRSAQLAAERQRDELRAGQMRERNALDAERGALAAQVRAEYMLGRADETRLLLSQTNPAAVGRMLAYYGYFARARAARVGEIAAREAHLAELSAAAELAAAKLVSLQEEAGREMSGLVRARQERTLALAALGEQMQSRHRQLAELKDEERAVESLLADLARVLEDFPVDAQQSFDRLRGRLPWPVEGRMTTRYQETRTNGAPTEVRLNGVMFETARGAKVRAPSAGRVVYADWLQGMGLLLIIAHSGNYLTLYGHTEVLYKSVGDWVAPGDVIAAVSDAGGTAPELYFEIRDGRKPVDPKIWLKPH
jgi:septal ring factor EnvC (AmiA/AmiB activator)